MGRRSVTIKYHRMIDAGLNPKEKPCSVCERWLPLAAFGTDRAKKDGLANLCRPCSRGRYQRWVTADPEKRKAASAERARLSREREPSRSQDAHRKHRYGMAPGDYDHIYEAQEGRCPVCDRGERRLVVDHCHKTQKVRGLLCYSCNIALHLIEDGYLESALRYLGQSDENYLSAAAALGTSL